MGRRDESTAVEDAAGNDGSAGVSALWGSGSHWPRKVVESSGPAAFLTPECRSAAGRIRVCIRAAESAGTRAWGRASGRGIAQQSRRQVIAVVVRRQRQHRQPVPLLSLTAAG